MLCYAMLCYAMLCYAILYCTILYYTILCYTMLCYAMLCYARLDYTIDPYVYVVFGGPIIDSLKLPETSAAKFGCARNDVAGTP